MTSETPPDPAAPRHDDMTARMAASPTAAPSVEPPPPPSAAYEPANDTPRFSAGPRPVPEPEPAPPPRETPASGGSDEPPSAKNGKKKRRRDGALVGYLSGLFTFLTLVVLGIGGAAIWGKLTFDGAGPLAQDTTVMVNKNQGLSEISDSLARAGVIDQPKLFELGVRLERKNDKLRYGEYAFPAHVSMREAMEILTSGKSIEYSVTIPEGLTSLQIVDRLRDQQMLTGEIKETPAEGSLLPETYRFTRGTPREQIIARMQEHQKAVLAEVWRERDPGIPIKSPEDLVTLASVVEKETGVPDERPRVASVFVNRLNKGMRLQSDPTIVYGIVAGRGTLGRGLNRGDIAKKTPYNTYQVQGLPAGPITNPGRQALEAAARPAKTSDLYFVADGSGGHAFAPSLIEHNKNVARWRQVEKSRGAPTDHLDPDDAATEAANETQDSTVTPAASPAPATTSSSSSTPPNPQPKPRSNAHRRQPQLRP